MKNSIKFCGVALFGLIELIYAAIKTLNLMKKNKSWLKLKNKGLAIKKYLKTLINIILILQFKV